MIISVTVVHLSNLMIHLLNDLVQLLNAQLHHMIFVYYLLFVTVSLNGIVFLIFHHDGGLVLHLLLWKNNIVIFFKKIALQSLAWDLIDHVLLLFFMSHKFIKFL